MGWLHIVFFASLLCFRRVRIGLFCLFCFFFFFYIHSSIVCLSLGYDERLHFLFQAIFLGSLALGVYSDRLIN